MVRSLLLFVSLSLVCAAPSAQEDPPDLRVEVSITGGFSPFSSISYTLRVQNGAGTIAVLKKSAAERGSREGLGMIPRSSLDSALQRLRECELDSLKTTKGKKNDSQKWRFVLTNSQGMRTFEVSDPIEESDGRYSACLRVFEDLAREHVGLLPFRDVFFPDDSMGFLQLDSVPRVRVFIDGADTGEVAPIKDFPLEVGQHVVTFVDAQLKINKTYTIRIMPGMTTNLDVDLR